MLRLATVVLLAPRLQLDVHHRQHSPFFSFDVVSGRPFEPFHNEPLHSRRFCARLACWSRSVACLCYNVVHESDLFSLIALSLNVTLGSTNFTVLQLLEVPNGPYSTPCASLCNTANSTIQVCTTFRCTRLNLTDSGRITAMRRH